MVFEDRISAYPGRYTMTDENGKVSYVVMERADEPTQEGTPLNAETFNKMQEEREVESEEYPGCFYRVINDTEYWINPPMVKGVEYRTVERYNGKPVYAQYIEGNFKYSDDFPDGGYDRRVAPNPSDKIVDIHVALKNDSTGDLQPLPWHLADGTINASYYLFVQTETFEATQDGIWARITAHKPCVGYRVQIMAKYIREEDVV